MWRALGSSRNLRLLFAGELVSRIGSAASFVAVWAVAVYDLRVSPAVLSVLILSNTLPRLVASSVAGRVVDRRDPRVVLIAANVIGIAGSLLQWSSRNAVELAGATVLAGIGFGAFMPAMLSVTPRVVDDEHLLSANALLGLTWQIGFIVGPLAGALAIEMGGVRAPLLLDAASFAVGIGFLLRLGLRPLEEDDEAAAGKPPSRLRDALRYTWSLPIARTVLVLSTGSWIGLSFFLVLEPIYISTVLGAGPVALGLLQTGFGVGAVLGSAMVSRAARASVNLLAVSLAICGGAMIVYTGTTRIAVAAAGVTLWGVGFAMMNPITRTLVQRGVPATRHGTVNGVLSTFQSGGEVLPVIFAGQLSAVLGVQAILVTAGIATIGLAVLGSFWARREARPVRVSRGLVEA